MSAYPAVVIRCDQTAACSSRFEFRQRTGGIRAARAAAAGAGWLWTGVWDLCPACKLRGGPIVRAATTLGHA